MARTKSSSRWLNEHFKDEFVKRAQKEGYRSRAVYKLDEIQNKDKIIKPGMVIVDLGAAPGGWAQYIRKIIGKKGRVIAMDLLEIEPIEGVDILQGDFREQEVLDQLLALLNGQKADLVISDIAPNISGMSAVDQPRGMYLCELALDFARQNLVPGGDFLVKVFQGEGFDEYIKDARESFEKIVFRKPKASRPRSREVYVLAKGLLDVAKT